MKKSNWGIGITVFYISFMIVVVAVAIFASAQKIDLVSPDYYWQELGYQKHIEKMGRTNELSQQILFNYENGIVKIKFPGQFSYHQISGKVHFFRPSDLKRDFMVNIQPSEQNVQLISTTKLIRGFWRVKIYWAAAGKSYFNEDSFFAN